MELTVNGRRFEPEPGDEQRPLLWYLRDRLELVGTKFGCGHGGCGACTVEIDGEAVPACSTTVRDAAGKHVVTIEGLAAEPDHPVFRAWLAEQVPQCGYCQPAMIVAATALLRRRPHPTDREIDEGLSGVLCRCGTYQRVRAAVHRAAEERWDDAPFAAGPLPPALPDVPPERARFDPWVAIARDGTVIVTIERSEMGQGVTTALAMLVAEELRVPLARVRTEAAPVDRAYDNPVIGMQITVGSMSMQNAWLRVRRAGADARERLVAAAAARWGIAPAACEADAGTVVERDGSRRLGYGELGADAAALAPRVEPALTEPSAFTLLGTSAARLEVPGHLAGRTVFGMDVRLPGQLAATVLLPPVLGAQPDRIDAHAALKYLGVRAVFAIDGAVAIVANDLWSALCAREVLSVRWSEGDTHLSSAAVRERLAAAVRRPGVAQRADGDVERVLDAGASVHEALYETPYQAHAPIEPIVCTARVAGGRCEVWLPTQGQTLARAAAARAAGVGLDDVEVHTTFLGGGFGRRSVPDVVTQAVQIARRIEAPVQLVWTRADDIGHDRYRPAGAALLRAPLDPRGRPLGILLRVAGPPLAAEGIEISYDLPHVRIETIQADPGLPTGYWRSVGASQNAFAIEGFVDELARAAGADPLAFRLALLERAPRHRAVLERAAERAGWGRVAPGRAQGVAVYRAHGGWAAQIAEVSVENGQIAVHRMTCAVDCGFAIDPDNVAAQVEGAIAFGLTAALKGEITVAGGRVEQHGFGDYPLLTLAEMPRVDVHVMNSTADPSGAGECGVPPAAPAVANAVFAATGERLRRLPLRVRVPASGARP